MNYSETIEVQDLPIAVWITVKPLKCKTYLLTVSLRVLESVGISETIDVQGVTVNNALGVCVCVCVQESVGITVKP